MRQEDQRDKPKIYDMVMHTHLPAKSRRKLSGIQFFSVLTFMVFLLSAAGCLWWAPANILDTHGRDACNATSSPGSGGRVYLGIEGGSGGKFQMTGVVYVPVWLWPKGVPGSQKGQIDLPDMSDDGEVHIPWLPLSVSSPVKTEFEGTEVYQMELEASPVGNGTLRAYPFDRYWVGIQSARLVLPLPSQSVQSAPNIPLELHVRFEGEPGWDAHRKIGADEPFHEGFESPDGSGSESPGARSCGLVISRSPWYIGLMAALLAVLGVAPCLYVWRRPTEAAGLELIAAMVGMATIRTYLIGPSSSVAGLLPFDVVLGAFICAVAFIPFWRPETRDGKQGRRLSTDMGRNGGDDRDDDAAH
ncbi:hypothetical protein [Burkholderia multivorans]|uniref:hypothetical protein n=1 Tax=Burkholderia multivorans TaxID=87883 RepID=UPI0011B27F74|nr:hypothetical protein [Burkholderia multivorans]